MVKNCPKSTILSAYVLLQALHLELYNFFLGNIYGFLAGLILLIKYLMKILFGRQHFHDILVAMEARKMQSCVAIE